MYQRVFVHVVGFNDVERHALNTLFRLSSERPTQYALWLPEAPEPARLTLVDGRSDGASDWMALIPDGHQGALFWVGPVAPAHAAKVFERPLLWPQVLRAMDALFIADKGDAKPDGTSAAKRAAKPQDTAAETDVDVDLEWLTAHVPLIGKRALLVNADADSREYFRAKLATVQVHILDEALNNEQALALLRNQTYDAVLIDTAPPNKELKVWKLASDMQQIKPQVRVLMVVVKKRNAWHKLRAWFAGVQAVLPTPPHPAELQALLEKI